MFIQNDNSKRINSYNNKDNLCLENSGNLIMNKNKLSHVKSLSGFLYSIPTLNEKVTSLQTLCFIQYRNRTQSQEITVEKLFNNPNISQRIKNKYSNVFIETFIKDNNNKIDNSEKNLKLKNFFYNNQNIEDDNKPKLEVKKKEIMQLLNPNNNRDNIKNHFIEKIRRRRRNESSGSQSQRNNSNKSYMNSEQDFPYKKMIHFRINGLEKILNRNNK